MFPCSEALIGCRVYPSFRVRLSSNTNASRVWNMMVWWTTR